MSTYVMSDIHGNYDLLQKALKEISFNDSDSLYILGDVIDRGEHAIRCLEFCKNNKNVTLLLGNHEYMMIETFDRKVETLNELIETDEFIRWMKNGGRHTLSDFILLDYWSQKELLCYLKSLPVIIPRLKVDDKEFYLSHAYLSKCTYFESALQSNMIKSDLENVIWKRTEDNAYELSEETKEVYKDTIFIHGHTSTDGKIKIVNNKFINIDCGSYKNNILGVLRLEDMKEFYAQKTPTRN